MKFLIWLLKKSEVLSAVSVRLVYLTGKSKVAVHPKHLIRKNSDLWYKNLLSKQITVLDIGCGTGQHSLQIAKSVKKVIGIDIDLKALEIAKRDANFRKIKNAQFLATDLEKELPLKEKSIDLVIMFDVLEHINKRQIFLKRVLKLLKDKGKILVVIPNTETSWKKLQRKYGFSSFSDPDHKIEYTKKGIQDELIKAGFKVDEIKAVAYDTPWVGFIDLTGGISLTLYKKLSLWKQEMAKRHPEDSSGYQIIASR